MCTCRNGGMLRSSLSTTGTGTWWSMSGCMHICIMMGRRYIRTCTYVCACTVCVHVCTVRVQKKSVCKVSNGREITFEVLRGTREMYNNYVSHAYYCWKFTIVLPRESVPCEQLTSVFVDPCLHYRCTS